MTLFEESLSRLRDDAIDIFRGALQDCDIERAFERHFCFQGKAMLRRQSAALPVVQSFEAVKRISVIAFGKAALPMLDALLTRLPPKVRIEGVCSSSDAPVKEHKHIRYYRGSHPIPNQDSVDAAKAAVELLRRARHDTLVFFLISGGGSAMFELPLDSTVPLDDVRAFYEALVLSGAPISEVNAVRKFFSAVKGGQLAAEAPNAQKVTILVADVAEREISNVASAPTLSDEVGWSTCLEILERRSLLSKMPATIRSFYERLIMNPPDSANIAAVANAKVEILLSSRDLVERAAVRAEALGYAVIVDNTCDDWPYDHAAAYLLEKLGTLPTSDKPLCLLSGGEITVEVNSADPGCGGRNQHFVLEAALRMDGGDAQQVVLSAGSDGIDGNSPAAGAVADPTTAMRARRFSFDPAQSLAAYNSCPLFRALGDAIVTGPTANNLRDLRVLLANR